VRAFCLCRLSIGFQGSFWGLCLCPAKSRFPTAEAGVGGDLVRMIDPGSAPKATNAPSGGYYTPSMLLGAALRRTTARINFHPHGVASERAMRTQPIDRTQRTAAAGDIVRQKCHPRYCPRPSQLRESSRCFPCRRRRSLRTIVDGTKVALLMALAALFPNTPSTSVVSASEGQTWRLS